MLFCKKYVYYTILCIPIALQAANLPHARKQNDHKRILQQKRRDSQSKENVLRQVHSFINSINQRIDHDPELRVKQHLTLPVASSSISGVEPIEHQHSNASLAPRVYGYVRVSQESLFTTGNGYGEKIGAVHFGEKLHVLGKSSEQSVYRNVKGYWLIVRRNNGNEGWIHDSALSLKKQAKVTKDIRKKRVTFHVPIVGRRTSNFGYRIHPITKKRSFHSGIDIAAPRGTAVKAAASGVVKVSAYKRNGYGNLVVIQHDNSFATYYGHLDKRKVRPGQKVSQGQVIGTIGSTGRATGPHLHFEVRKGSKALDPDAFLAATKSKSSYIE